MWMYICAMPNAADWAWLIMHGGWLKGRALSSTSPPWKQCKCLQYHCQFPDDDGPDHGAANGDDEVAARAPHYVALAGRPKNFGQARVAYKLASVWFWQQPTRRHLAFIRHFTFTVASCIIAARGTAISWLKCQNRWRARPKWQCSVKHQKPASKNSLVG